MRFNGIVTLFAAALVMAIAPTAKGENSCRLESLKGSYGYTVVGTITADGGQPPFIAGPFSAVGRIVFDGHGNVSTVRAFSDNGAVFTGDMGKGTYTISNDCTGSFNITVSAPGATGQLNLNFVLDDDNDEIRAIVTNQGFILTLEGHKQHAHLTEVGNRD